MNAVDDPGSSALMYAALYSDLATMRLLLDKGADPNHADKSGATALMWSVRAEDNVRLLVADGADVTVTSSVTGGTAHLIAAGRPGAARIVKFLLDKGDDPKKRDKVGFTPLHRAAFNGDLEMVKLLIDRGTDVKARGAGMTPLFGAVNANHAAVVDLLIAHGADANAKTRMAPGFWRMPPRMRTRRYSES